MKEIEKFYSIREYIFCLFNLIKLMGTNLSSFSQNGEDIYFSQRRSLQNPAGSKHLEPKRLYQPPKAPKSVAFISTRIQPTAEEILLLRTSFDKCAKYKIRIAANVMRRYMFVGFQCLKLLNILFLFLPISSLMSHMPHILTYFDNSKVKWSDRLKTGDIPILAERGKTMLNGIQDWLEVVDDISKIQPALAEIAAVHCSYNIPIISIPMAADFFEREILMACRHLDLHDKGCKQYRKRHLQRSLTRPLNANDFEKKSSVSIILPNCDDDGASVCRLCKAWERYFDLISTVLTMEMLSLSGPDRLSVEHKPVRLEKSVSLNYD